ncbi:glycosyltransferase, partial [Salmonella enterica]|nr:glycosyltransferase [Salmonella enterica]
TVVYNGEKYIEDTIKSVLSQPCINDIEYIIIDGASTDNTLNIINKYKQHLALVISEKDNGIYDAMNKGIEKATGKYIGFINADDFYNEGALCHAIEIMKANEYDIIYGNMFMVDVETLEVKGVRRPKHWKLNIDMNLSHPATFVKSSVHKINLFDLNYKIAADYDLMLKLKKKKCTFHYIDKNISSMRNGGVSVRNIKLANKEAKIIRIKRNGILFSLVASMYLAMRRIIKA